MIEPPGHVVEVARARAAASPCGKSQRGSVVFNPTTGAVYGHSANHLPGGLACAEAERIRRGVPIEALAIAATDARELYPIRDAGILCRDACGTRCVHAEAGAILHARQAATVARMAGLEIAHVKTVGGVAVPSGGPSCVPCAALILDVGLDACWLLHQVGPSCPGERCPYCSGADCAPCAGRPRPWDPLCDHDVMERHEGAPPPALAWRRYPAAEFYRLSCEARGLPTG